MSVIHTPSKPKVDARMLVFPIVIFMLLSMLFLRLWYFQVVKAEELVQRATIFNTSSVSELAPRGLIFDRNGVLLAGVKPQMVITGVPAILKKNPRVLPRIAAMLQGAQVPVDQEKLEDKLRQGAWRPWLPTAIYIGAPVSVASKIAEELDDLPGIGVQSQPMRYYPDSKSFSHVMGYVAVPSKDDVSRMAKLGIKTADYVGKGGHNLEVTYEQQLMGAPGAQNMELDAKRHPTRVVGHDAATPGEQLVLTIDKNLQQLGAQLLQGYRGAIVALDPSTGEVLCMVSAPSYDLKQFEGGISSAQWKALTDDPDKPMYDRALGAAFAPGSTFKIVTSLAAAESGKFNPDATVYCAGGLKVGNRFMKCLGHHGSLSYRQALAKSCNTFFMTLGISVGQDQLRAEALKVGLYDHTGIDIGGDVRGLVPTDEWIEKNRNPARWYPGDTANLSIGQGSLAVTPIQMANLIALVANEGVNYVPHLVRAIRPPGQSKVLQEIQPKESHRINPPASFWPEIKSALQAVIESGTAERAAHIDGLAWGGKTGSAEQKKGALTHSWFVGFAPMDHPKIAICVLLQEAGHGTVAAGLAKQIVQTYLAPPHRAGP